MRLIDADELSNVMYHQAFETDTDSQKWDSGCWIRYKMFENAIESAPTIDPVNHGQWETYDTYKQTIDGRTFDGWCECSECRTMFPWGFSTYNYCPNCGCKMMV